MECASSRIIEQEELRPTPILLRLGLSNSQPVDLFSHLTSIIETNYSAAALSLTGLILRLQVSQFRPVNRV